MVDIPKCLECGACCVSGLGVYLDSLEIDYFQSHPKLRKLIQGNCLRITKGVCCAFKGKFGSACSCDIYQDRPLACRDFNRGCEQCRVAISRFRK